MCTGNGGLGLGGPRQGWKRRPSDGVITLSQLCYDLLIRPGKGICGPSKDTFLWLRHGWHSWKCKSVFMIPNFRNT